MRNGVEMKFMSGMNKMNKTNERMTNGMQPGAAGIHAFKFQNEIKMNEGQQARENVFLVYEWSEVKCMRSASKDYKLVAAFNSTSFHLKHFLLRCFRKPI